jgi:voltage-gated potassium channel Kch
LRYATSFFGIVFIGFLLITVTILGTLMYVVEGPENGFTSIPIAIYWGITTMTTVGFGAAFAGSCRATAPRHPADPATVPATPATVQPDGNVAE